MSLDIGIVHHLFSRVLPPADLLDRACGEVGLDHVTVPVVTPAIDMLRLAAGDESPRYFQSEGGWHYPPEAAHYAGALKPRAARWFRKTDHLDRLTGELADRELRFVAWVSPYDISPITDAAADVGVRDAWGEPVPGAGACPLGDEMRTLVQGILTDLARYAPAAVILAGTQLDTPPTTATQPLTWHPLVRRLLDKCFCAACRQAATLAGIDVDAAARSVRVRVGGLLSEPVAQAHDEPDELLAAYDIARRNEHARWLATLADEAPCDCHLHSANPVPELVAGWQRLLDLTGAGPIDREQTPSADGLCLPVWRPTNTDSAELVRRVTQAAGAGLRYFDFAGLEVAPPEALTWLRQAVRYARRG